MNTYDILLLEDLLSEEELSIQQTARIIEDHLMPRILEANRNEVFDKEIYKETGEIGFLGALIVDMVVRV